MSTDSSNGILTPPPTQGLVRVRLRYAAFETFLERFAPNVTRGGVFLASRAPRPVGDIFPFEVLLAGGEVALSGDGKVTWVKEYDPAAPTRPHGMGVQFLRLDAPSREAVSRMLARKAANAAATPTPTAGTRPPTAGANGRAAPRLDTNVDLAAELGVDETQVRRAVDRHRLVPGRAAGEADELDALLRPEPAEGATLAQALAELPRLLDPNSRRRTGAFRPLSELFPAGSSNGTSDDGGEDPKPDPK